MRILLTGGGTGGHFYPVVAVAESVRTLAKKFKLVGVELFYMSNNPYNQGILFEHDIQYIPTSAGKMRRYFSVLNFFDFFKTGWGALKSLFKIYSIFPDVVFGKGGYASFPALLSARILGIPVVIHESDTVPGRVNIWAGKFAKSVAVSYPQAAEYFPKARKEGRVIHTGQPVREELRTPLTTGAREYLKLEDGTPVILVLGGSLGAQKINNAILDALPELVKKYQIIHQTGKEHHHEVTSAADTLLSGNPHKSRYKAFDYLNTLSMRMCAGITDIVITRAGSTLFEVAWWGVPALVVPITDTNGDHQMRNAYAYAQTGAAVVIEEKNLKPHVVLSEIERILTSSEILNTMQAAAKKFTVSNAAEKIAEEVIRMAVTHGKKLKGKTKKVEEIISEVQATTAPTTPQVTFISQEFIPENVVMEDTPPTNEQPADGLPKEKQE